MENGIRRPRTADTGVKAAPWPPRLHGGGFEFLDYGPDNFNFLTPELSGFPRVRIEARNGNAGRFHGEVARHRLRSDAYNFSEQLFCEQARDVGQGFVNRCERHP